MRVSCSLCESNGHRLDAWCFTSCVNEQRTIVKDTRTTSNKISSKFQTICMGIHEKDDAILDGRIETWSVTCDPYTLHWTWLNERHFTGQSDILDPHCARLGWLIFLVEWLGVFNWSVSQDGSTLCQTWLIESVLMFSKAGGIDPVPDLAVWEVFTVQ